MSAGEAYDVFAPAGDMVNLPELANAMDWRSIFAAPDQGEYGAKETILLVEDEPFVRTATAEVLASAGYEVVLAGDASEALNRERHCLESVDLLLADVVMPGLSGHDLAVRFSLLNPQGKILLMSGYSEQLAFGDLAPQCREYLAKPFSIPTLLRRVREVLDKNILDAEMSA